MDERKWFTRFMWIAVGGALASFLCLATSGAGDDADSFRTYLLCCAIVLGSSMLALALSCGRKD